MYKFILMLAVFLITFGSKYADRVTPSDRASSHLNVRSDPVANNQIISRSDPDDSVALLEEVQYWFRIRLYSRDEGFVSKAWSTVILADLLLQLGTWNIKKLGYNNDQDFATIAQIIEDHFDILAVVEVMQKQPAHLGYDDLLATLGQGWAGMVTASPRPRTGFGNSEFYAVVYREDGVRPCVGWDSLNYFDDNDGSDIGEGPDHFSREPAYGCFAAPAKGAVGVDFLLGAYHARWAGGDTSEIQREAARLGEIFAAMGTTKPGERDLWIVGDFNLVRADLRALFPTGVMSANDGGTTLNRVGDRADNGYDHVLVHDAAESSELIGQATVREVRQYALTPIVFYDWVSDHLPVVISVRTTDPDEIKGFYLGPSA